MQLAEWLEATTVADVSTRDVATLSPDAPMAEAAALLLTRQVSGAPVVDARGVCVGVISVSDFLGADQKVEQERRKLAESSFWSSPLALPSSVYAEKLAEVRDRIVPAAGQPVHRFMTADLVTVQPDAPLSTVIRYMIDAHVHRVIVVDDQQRLKGIISTTDILAALMRAASQSASHKL